MAGGPVQEEKARPGGPVQNIFDVGGGGGGGRGILASLPGQEGTHRSLYTVIRLKRLPPRQQFSASRDAYSISLALNNICPRSHFHTGNNATGIPLNGFTVYSFHSHSITMPHGTPPGFEPRPPAPEASILTTRPWVSCKNKFPEKFIHDIPMVRVSR
jgi:hypothetical protein